MNRTIVCIGDTHHMIELAMLGLEALQDERGRQIDLVVSVGDFGLFLDAQDWSFLSGPAKYAHPEDSPALRECWDRWPWKTYAIAGNHEPFNRLRQFRPEYFDGKLTYLNAGKFPEPFPQCRIYGLSGIHHPEQEYFPSPWDKAHDSERAWQGMVEEARAGKIKRQSLSYYKRTEIEALGKLSPSPHLLLTHDWPVPPPHLPHNTGDRPEGFLMDKLKPIYHCCGHHHTTHSFILGETEVIALNIITSPRSASHGGVIEPGWAAVFEFDEASAEIRHSGLWPKEPVCL